MPLKQITSSGVDPGSQLKEGEWRFAPTAGKPGRLFHKFKGIQHQFWASKPLFVDRPNTVLSGEDDTVLILNAAGNVRSDEIDPKVWALKLVDYTGTPADNHIAVFTDVDTIEGASDFTRDGTTLSYAANTDALAILGPGKFGYNGADSDRLTIAHFDRFDATDFGFQHLSTGGTIVNAATGQGIFFKINDVDQGAWNATGLGIGTITPTVLVSANEKCGMTSIGGFVVKLTNNTGVNSVEGQLVEADNTDQNSYKKADANAADVIGIVYNAGIADGSETWIVTNGIAEVLLDAGGCVHHDRLISSATAGSADVWNVGGAVATHFQEIGHAIETVVGAGLAKVILHFN